MRRGLDTLNTFTCNRSEYWGDTMPRSVIIVFLAIALSIVLMIVVYRHVETQRLVLIVLPESYISLADGVAVLHLKNEGKAAIVLSRVKVEGVGEATDLKVWAGDGIWVNSESGEVGLNVGGEGYIMVDLDGLTARVAEGQNYTLLIFTREGRVFKAEVPAVDVPAKVWRS